MKETSTFPVQLYASSRKGIKGLLTVARACYDGFWLGMLSREQLHAIDEHFYEGRGVYRTRAYNQQGLSAAEKRVVERHFPQGGRVLVIGAGGGREVLALSRRGYRVDGYECHPKLAAFADELLRGEAAEDAQVAWLPRDEVPPGDQVYDGVIVGWGAYMLIQGRVRRERFLNDLRRRVRAGGVVLLSFYHRGMSRRRFRVAALVANTLRQVRGEPRVEVGDGLEPNYVHYFTQQEVSRELHAAGFELVYYSGGAYGYAVGRVTETRKARPEASPLPTRDTTQRVHA